MVLEQFIIDADIIWDQVGKTFFENPEAKPGRIMRVQVVNAGIIEDLTGYTLNLGWTSVRDPFKFGLDAFDDVDITKGIFEIEYTSGMLTNIGPLNASLQLVPPGEGRPIESNNFKLTVKNSAINPEAIQGETSFKALENALVEVNGWNARIDVVEQEFKDRADALDGAYPVRLTAVEKKSVQIQETKVDKNGSGQVGWANIAQDARLQIIGDMPPAVVGDDSVITSNLTNNAVTVSKLAVATPYTDYASAPYESSVFETIAMSDYHVSENDGFLLNNQNVMTVLETYTVTDYIPLKKLMSYNLLYRNLLLYDANKNYLGSATGFLDNAGYITKTIGIPDAAYFGRVSIRLTDYPAAVIKRVTPLESEILFKIPNLKFGSGELSIGHQDTDFLQEDTDYEYVDDVFEVIKFADYHVPENDGYSLNVTNGLRVSSEYTTTLTVSDYIPVKKLSNYKPLYRAMAVYNSSLVYIGSATGFFDNAGYTSKTVDIPIDGYVRWVVKIVDKDVATMYRLTPQENEKFLRMPRLKIKTKYEGKKTVALGDSIMGNYEPPESIPYFLSKELGMDVYNCAIGGTKMAYLSNGSTVNSGSYLVDSIISGDFSEQIAYANANMTGVTLTRTLARLDTLANLDWLDVDYLVTAYGTNDYLQSVALDDGTRNSIKGAYRYFIQTILTAYPHLKLLLVTPPYNYAMTTIPSGKELDKYVQAVVEVASELHVPVVDNYTNAGINDYNRLNYFDGTDKTHPVVIGRRLLADRIIGEFKRNY